MASITATGLMLCVETRLFRSDGSVVKFTKLANTSAPTKIMNSMPVVRALSIKMSKVTETFSDLRNRAMMKAPKAPMPAPSVVVKTPP